MMFGDNMDERMEAKESAAVKREFSFNFLAYAAQSDERSV
jgi:hypothetical protein